MTVYEIVTERIIEQLDKGIIPWKRPWNECEARNWKTGREYNGINNMLLQPGEYLTFKQVQEAGGRVKKGEKAHPIFFFKVYEKENDAGDSNRIPICQFYNVFEVSQCEGIERKFLTEGTPDFNPIEAAEEIIKSYSDAPDILHHSGGASYSPFKDVVLMPERELFHSEAEYYSTLFHELTHSTGAKHRLDRKGIYDAITHSENEYGKEELIAEMGSAMLCARARIESTISNTISYIQEWRRIIRGDAKLVMMAATQAQKAVNYIMGE